MCEIQLNLLGESSRHLLRMAVDGMKEPRETEAENSPQEEHPEYHFLLQRGHEIHVGPQHGQCAQTKE